MQHQTRVADYAGGQCDPEFQLFFLLRCCPPHDTYTWHLTKCFTSVILSDAHAELLHFSLVHSRHPDLLRVGAKAFLTSVRRAGGAGMRPQPRTNRKQHVTLEPQHRHLADNLREARTSTPASAMWPFKQHRQAQNQPQAPSYDYFSVCIFNVRFCQQKVHAVLPKDGREKQETSPDFN